MAKTTYCQSCGKDISGAERTFYGNVICSEACRETLSAAIYFRDEPPDPDGTWFCPHCGSENPLGDPRQDDRPDCTSCGKPLDPASSSPPRKSGKKGCLGALLWPLMLLGGGLAAAQLLG